ncbi:hypothetical protein [Desulfatitalea tepidiphila]|uniref:hypothetical protein n=1 Tax=Desulfatitalea tepidiphila TaxID=1185843 RepID=UPI0006B611AC|nr:hypothetical protein [Desulfatitalea tepidiphila]
MKSKSEILSDGTEILKPLMVKNGFQFFVEGKGQSSGGNFAFGSWKKEDRKLEYHFRFSLGLVEYSLCEKSIGHEFFLWALTGQKRIAKYPGSSEDPLDGFRRLFDDLNQYCAVFLSGSDSELEKALQKAEKLKKYWESLSPFKKMEIK